MQSKLRPYSWFSLLLSLLAAVFSGGYYYVKRVFDLPAIFGIGIFIIGIALYTLINPDAIRKVFTGKTIRYASNAAIFTAALFAILLAVNLIVNKQDKSWDLSQDQINTLSPQTIEILHGLPGKVEAIAFFSTKFARNDAEVLLKNMAANSAGKFTYRFVDPNAEPLVAKQYALTADGTIIFTLNGYQQDTKIASETEFDTALLKLSNPTSPVIYALTGHGEHDPWGTSGDSYALLRTALEKKNYIVKPLNLLESNQIPADASVIIIPGPRKPLSSPEVELLRKYLAGGKALVVFQDPRVITDFGASPDPLADMLNLDWGIKLADDFVLDMNSNPASQIIASQYGDHPITQRMAGIASIFPSTQSLTLADPAPEGIKLTGLVFTSTNSWGETDLEGLKQNKFQFDQSADFPGPLALGAVSENSKTKAKLVVMGSSAFAMDQNYTVYGNGDLAVNIIDWASENEQIMNITLRDTTQRMLIPPSQTYISILFLISIIIIPGAIVTVGVLVWLNRRKKI